MTDPASGLASQGAPATVHDTPPAVAMDPLLLELTVNRLAPLFLADAGGYNALARRAALQTVTQHYVHTGANLLLIAQFIAFSIIAVTTATQSMQPGLSLEDQLRLRKSAASLRHGADRSHKAMAPPPAKPAAQPKASHLKAAQLTAPQSGSAQPSTAQPSTTTPSAAQPSAAQPSAAQSTVAQSGVPTLGADDPAASLSASASVTASLAAEKPASTKNSAADHAE